jgi:hypothetical protein
MFKSYQQLDNIGLDIKAEVSPADLVQAYCITQSYIDQLRTEIGPRNKRYWIVAELDKLYTVVPFLNNCKELVSAQNTTQVVIPANSESEETVINYFDGSIREYIDTSFSGQDRVLFPTTDIEDDTVDITASNIIYDFGGSTLRRGAANNYALRVLGSNNIIRNLTVDGDFVENQGFRGEGIRDQGSNNVFEDCTSKDFSPGPDSYAFFGFRNTTWRRCHGQNAGRSIWRLRSGATVENCTGHYAAITTNIDYGTATRPRWIVGGREDPSFGYDTILVKDSTFTSDGAWARCVLDAADGFRLSKLRYENVVFDNRGAVFNKYVSTANERSMHKSDNIELIEFDGVVQFHDQSVGTMPMMHFVKCGTFTCDNVNSDTYIVLFSPAGGGLKNIVLRDSNFGVNGPIRRLIDIGPQSSNWDTDVESVVITNVTASNIQDSFGLYANTANKSVWTINDLTLNFASAGGQLAESNEAADIDSTNVTINP